MKRILPILIFTLCTFSLLNLISPAPVQAQDGAAADGVEQEAEKSFDPLEDPSEFGTGAGLFEIGLRDDVSLAPLRAPRTNLFHSIFLLPEMEEPDGLEQDERRVRMGINISDGDFEDTSGANFVLYEAGPLTEIHLEYALGVSDTTEFRTHIEFGQLAGDDDDLVVARGGVQIVPPRSRGSSLSDWVIGIKQQVWQSEDLQTRVAASLDLKIPFSSGKDDFLTSGGIDGAIMVLASQDLDNWRMHLNLGYVMLGNEDIFDANVELEDPLVYGLGLMYKWSDALALGIQAQGNFSAYDADDDPIDALNEGPISAHVGARWRLGSYFIEVNAGTGFNDVSADTLFHVSWEIRF